MLCSLEQGYFVFLWSFGEVNLSFVCDRLEVIFSFWSDHIIFRCVVTGCTNEFWGLKSVVMAPLSTLQMSSAAMTPRNVASMYIYALAISYAYAALYIIRLFLKSVSKPICIYYQLHMQCKHVNLRTPVKGWTYIVSTVEFA